MRNYEAMFIFRPDEDVFTRGKEAVKEELTKANAEIEKEDDMGQRVLAYPIKKLERGHYYLYQFKMDPQNVIQAEKALKLKPEILKFLFVKQEK